MSVFTKLYEKIFEVDALGQRFYERELFGKKAQAKSDTLAPLCKQISFMLSAGVPVRSAITVLAESSNKRKNKAMKASLNSVLKNIVSGDSLSYSLDQTQYFPKFMCKMCQIGEISDNLPMVMSLLADYYEEMAKNKDEIRSALLYPAIITAMMFALILAAVLFVLPNYSTIFEMSEVPLPVLTQVLLNISHGLINNWYVFLPIFILLIVMPSVLYRTSRGRFFFESLLLNMPIVSGIYRQIVNLYILQAIDILLQSGRSLVEAIPAVADIMENRRVAADLRQLAIHLQEGTDFWVLLNNIHYIDTTVTGMVRAGEETGNMDQIFSHANSYVKYQFSQMARRLNKLVEPIITLVLGLVLALVMLSIILPTFAMTEFFG